MPSLSRRTIGIIEITISGIGFGFIGVFGKWAFIAGLTPGELLSLRFLLAAILLGLGLALFSPARLKIPARQLCSCALLGILGYAVFASCFYAALERLSASLTVLLLYTYPVLVTVGAALLFRERLTRRIWYALPLAAAGMLLLVWGDVSVGEPSKKLELEGLALGVLSAVFYSTYILASSRLLRGVAPITSGFYVQLSAALALAVFELRHPAHAWSALPQAFWPVAGTAVLSTVLPITLFLSGLQKLKNSEASILSTAEPLTAIIAANLLLGERLSGVQFLGAAAVIATLLLIATAPPHHEPAAEPFSKR